MVAARNTRRRANRCTHCDVVGHFADDCPDPHQRCTPRRCHVPRNHTNFRPRDNCHAYVALQAHQNVPPPSANLPLPISITDMDLALGDYDPEGIDDSNEFP